MSTLKKLGPAAFAFLVVTLVPMLAFAADEAGANANTVKAYAAIGAGLAIGLGVLGGTLSQGRAAAAALEGISRNPGATARLGEGGQCKEGDKEEREDLGQLHDDSPFQGGWVALYRDSMTGPMRRFSRLYSLLRPTPWVRRIGDRCLERRAAR